MTTMSSYNLTDGLDYPLADHINSLRANVSRTEYVNTETITATKELADTDTPFQVITPSGADRTVELPPEATSNHPFLIFNAAAAQKISVKDDSGATTYKILSPNEFGYFVQVNGKGWKQIDRQTMRWDSVASSATPTINTDYVDCYSITALAAAITSFTTNLSGTPTNFQKLTIRIKDDGTARGITWGASFEAKGVALPTTTVLSKVLTVGFMYDTVTSKWGCVAVANEA